MTDTQAIGKTTRKGVAWSALSAGALLLAAVVSAHEPGAHGKMANEATSVEAKAVTIKLLDLELHDQDGRRVRLKSDVVRDRLVVIDTIYTTCPVVCPILSSVFARLQETLGERLGKDVLLVSISIDPTTDIPPRLKAYAQRWNARPGWVFLTGDQRNVAEILRGLNAYAADVTGHPAMILVGDGARGRWRRFYDVPHPDTVLGELDELRPTAAPDGKRVAP